MASKRGQDATTTDEYLGIRKGNLQSTGLGEVWKVRDRTSLDGWKGDLRVGRFRGTRRIFGGVKYLLTPCKRLHLIAADGMR